MPLLVMKFGGTSVADLARIENAAQKVAAEVERGYDVIVIVSRHVRQDQRTGRLGRKHLDPLRRPRI